MLPLRALIGVLFIITIVRLTASSNGPAATITTIPILTLIMTTSNINSASAAASSSPPSLSRHSSSNELHVGDSMVDGSRIPPLDGEVTASQLAAIVDRIVAERLQAAQLQRSSSMGSGRVDGVDDDTDNHVDASSSSSSGSSRSIPVPPNDPLTPRHPRAHLPDARSHTSSSSDGRTNPDAHHGSGKSDAHEQQYDIPEPGSDWMQRLSENSEAVSALLVQRLHRLALEVICMIGVAIIFWFQSQSQRRLAADYGVHYQKIMTWMDTRIIETFPPVITPSLPAATSASPVAAAAGEMKYDAATSSSASASSGGSGASTTSTTDVPHVNTTSVHVQPAAAAAAAAATATSKLSDISWRHVLPSSAMMLLTIYIMIIIAIGSLVQTVWDNQSITTNQRLLLAAILIGILLVRINDHYMAAPRPSWLQWCHRWLATGAVYVFIAPLVSVLLYVCLIIMMIVEALTRSAGVLVVIGIALRMILPSHLWYTVNDVFWGMWQTAALLALSLAVINFFRLSSRAPSAAVTVTSSVSSTS